MKPPNILFLVLDTQRADRLSCYGYPVETSPHIDKFAAESTLFTRAIAPAQWTIPSHASMFTGLYPPQHSLWQLDSVLPEIIPTLAERLQQAGYFTACFSNNAMVGILNNGLERGFQEIVNYAGVHYQQKNQKDKSALRSLFDKSLAQVEQSSVAKKIALSPLFKPLSDMIYLHKVNAKGNTAQSLTDAAQLLIDRSRLARNQPLFVFINLMETHTPYYPPTWAIEKFAPQLHRQQIDIFLKQFNSDMKSLPDVLTEPINPEYKAMLDELYNAEVAVQDAQLGIFLDRLQRTGVLQDTFVIIVSDHGDHLGEKQLLGHRYGVFEELIHVPLLIMDPQDQFPPGVAWKSPVSTRRIFHTLLAVARAATPAEEVLSLAQSEDKPDTSPIFATSWPPQKRLSKQDKMYLQTQGYEQPHFAIYDDGYKLIVADKTCLGLYEIITDSEESHDLQFTLPEKTQALYQKLQDFRQQPYTSTQKMEGQLDDPILLERLRDLGYIE